MKYDSPKMTAWAAGEDEIEKKRLVYHWLKLKGGRERCESQLFEYSKREDCGENV